MTNLLADGFDPADLARVYAPVGLDLGFTSPQEIAVAILAEVIGEQWKKITGNTPVKIRRLDRIPQTAAA